MIDRKPRWKEAYCGDEHTFIIDKKNQIWALGNNRNDKLGVKGIDLLLKPEPFIVNQEALNKKVNQDTGPSLNTENQDFTQQAMNNHVIDEIETN